jgi:hypothetical protein
MSTLYDTETVLGMTLHQLLKKRSVAINTPSGIHEYTKIKLQLEDHIDSNINEFITARNNLGGSNFLSLNNHFLLSSHKLPTSQTQL